MNMAYHELSNPAAVLNREITLTRNFFGAIAAFFSDLGTSLTMASSAQKRFDQIQALHAKTDAELAELKIERSEIVHVVFKDLYYI
jgi:hypothetical protein